MSVESSVKILQYIANVAKEPIVLNGKPFSTTPPEKVVLHQMFFMKDDCQMCGKCCPNETTVWTYSGLADIHAAKDSQFSQWDLDFSIVEDLKKGIQEIPADINGRAVMFYTHPADHPKEASRLSWEDRAEQPRCHWLFEKNGSHLCRIHPVRSVTCGMPHLRLMYNQASRSTSVRLSQFGRNWKLACPIQFGEFDEASVLGRIHWLAKLYQCSVDLQIETFLPEILEYLLRGKRQEKVFTRQTKKTLFTVERRS